jgi:hypothetical protein
VIAARTPTAQPLELLEDDPAEDDPAEDDPAEGDELLAGALAAGVLGALVPLSLLADSAGLLSLLLLADGLLP